MVNITYGQLSSPDAAGNILASGSSYLINSAGTDLLATLPDGTVIAYNPGDMSVLLAQSARFSFAHVFLLSSAWVLTCTALVFVMIPGLGFLYSGCVGFAIGCSLRESLLMIRLFRLVRRKNALSLLLLTMLAMAIISFQVRIARSCLLGEMLTLLFSGSSGATLSPSPKREAPSSAISTTLASATLSSNPLPAPTTRSLKSST